MRTFDFRRLDPAGRDALKAVFRSASDPAPVFVGIRPAKLTLLLSGGIALFVAALLFWFVTPAAGQTSPPWWFAPPAMILVAFGVGALVVAAWLAVGGYVVGHALLPTAVVKVFGPRVVVHDTRSLTSVWIRDKRYEFTFEGGTMLKVPAYSGLDPTRVEVLHDAVDQVETSRDRGALDEVTRLDSLRALAASPQGGPAVGFEGVAVVIAVALGVVATFGLWSLNERAADGRFVEDWAQHLDDPAAEEALEHYVNAGGRQRERVEKDLLPRARILSCTGAYGDVCERLQKQYAGTPHEEAARLAAEEVKARRERTKDFPSPKPTAEPRPAKAPDPPHIVIEQGQSVTFPANARPTREVEPGPIGSAISWTGERGDGTTFLWLVIEYKEAQPPMAIRMAQERMLDGMVERWKKSPDITDIKTDDKTWGTLDNLPTLTANMQLKENGRHLSVRTRSQWLKGSDGSKNRVISLLGVITTSFDKTTDDFMASLKPASPPP